MLGLRTPVPFLATAILLAVPAKATTSYYVGASSEAAFNTAVGGLSLLNTTLTFSSGDLAPGGLYDANDTGITFLGFGDFIFNEVKDFTVSSFKLTASANAQVVKITFPPTGIYALGFHITVTTGAASWFIAPTPSGTDYSVTNTSPTNVQFFGIVSDTPITASLYIRPSGSATKIVFPDFAAYTTSAPEPRTMLMVGLGLTILPLARRIRKRV